jgi:PIN domain nuclease of toxin-antitoxin system
VGQAFLPADWQIAAAGANTAARNRRHHTDRFDRILLAQAHREGLGIMAADRQFFPYGIKVVW